MSTILPPYADPGRAVFQELDTYTQNYLLAGSDPELAPAYSFPLPNSVSYPQFQVVGLSAAGKLVPATRGNADPANDIKAIGVLAHASSLGASGSGNGPVWYSGCFNQNALVWDASFTTDAQKQAAFRGAPTPTTIIVAKRGV
ncbi:head decoration protein [Mesorhizobium sp. AR07]|uniref:head decoration protein n=1 Tax=Mesorhizobium sp. AR07 TaxID=2865838 RepID=UPI00215E3293|nr:head decoration protein [Mesorhizobium sp. AR07]UVK46825.1 head decoration protein [Mesorhizobium sp. AR07]